MAQGDPLKATRVSREGGIPMFGQSFHHSVCPRPCPAAAAIPAASAARHLCYSAWREAYGQKSCEGAPGWWGVWDSTSPRSPWLRDF